MGGIKFDIPRDKYDKIMHWVNSSKDEVSGFGTVTCDKGVFALEEVFLLEQKVGGAHTDIDAKSLADLEFDVIKSRATGQLNFWWHSHVMMPVFWSGTDTATIKELGAQGWILATVFNQKNEHRTAFCASTSVPMIGPIVHFEDQVPTSVTSYYPAELIEAWNAEFKEKVTDKNVPESYAKRWSENWGPYGHWDQMKQRWIPASESDPEPGKQISLLTEPVATKKTLWDEEMAEEARLLGMKFKAYKKIQMSQDWEKIEELEMKLMKIKEERLGLRHGAY